MHRRQFLAASAAGLPAVAGCSLRGSGGEGPRLESLDVRGSPGGTISVRPPERVVLLDFFATWCTPCKPEMENLRRVRERSPVESVFMVSITQESDREAIRRFWREYRGAWPVTIDADLEATQEYDVTGIPTIIVLTPDGTETMRHTGLAGEKRIASSVRDALEMAGLG